MLLYRYLRAIDLQIEVTTFLCDQTNLSLLQDYFPSLESITANKFQQQHSTGSNSDLSVVGSSLPTLFDSPSSRAYLVAMVCQFSKS